MRPKEPITDREIEVLLLLASKKSKTGKAIGEKLEKTVDRTSTWKTLHSLENKGLIKSDWGNRGPTPRGGRSEIKIYSILDDAYEEIYQELKKRDCKFIPVVAGKFIVSHPFPSDIDKRYPGEDIFDYMKRTGFSDPCQARAFKEQFTEVRRATDKEIALYNILKNCCDLIQEKEELEREYKKYSNGYAAGPYASGPAYAEE